MLIIIQKYRFHTIDRMVKYQGLYNFFLICRSTIFLTLFKVDRYYSIVYDYYIINFNISKE